MESIYVLIVDENPFERIKIVNKIGYLNHYSYLVFEADNYDKAFELVSTKKIGLLLISISSTSSFGLATYLKFKYHFPSVARIILTEQNDDGIRNKLIEAGIEDFLIKETFSTEELFSMINSVHERNKIELLNEATTFFYESAFDALPDSVAILDGKGNIIYVNKHWKEFAIAADTQLVNYDVGTNYIEVSVLSDDENQTGYFVAKAINDILKGRKENFTINYPCQSNDKKCWYTIVLTYFEIDGRRKIVVTHKEVIIEKEVKNVQSTSDRIFEHSVDLLCIIGFDGYLKVINPSWSYTLGWSKEELLSKPLIEFVHPEDISETNRMKSRIIEGRQIYQFENRFLCKDGSVKWLSWNSFPYPDEYIMFGVARDVTEKKEGESKLTILNQVVEQSPVSIVVTDLNGNIEYVNAEFCSITGYDPDEVIGANPRILKSGKTTEEEYKELWDTITSGKIWQGEFYNKRKDGTSFWELAKISPIIDNGRITHFVGAKEDITKRKEFEAELIKSKKDAEKADRLKSEFLTQISHEIRTPINTLLNFSSLIKDDLGVNVTEDQAYSFNYIESAGKRLIRTIDLLIKISELQSDNYEPEFIENDLLEIIEEILPEHKKNAIEKNLHLQIIVKTDKAKIIVDKFSITDVLNNLIDNAIKFTEKGTIKIIVEKTIASKVSVSIQDSGVGISEEYIANIFSPFTQESGGYTRKFEGNGLGLSLVKQYCKLNSVEIIVHSQKMMGSNISLFFN